MYEQQFEDVQIACTDCGADFTFSADDQEFYSSKGFSNPKRCSVCRANRKMNSGQRGGGYNRRQYDVVCSACGVQTTVPFEPKGDRPVYCSDCYRSNY